MASAADLEQKQSYRVPHGFFTSRLSEIDPAVEDAIHDELRREQTQIELIASENIVSARFSPTNMPKATLAAATTRAALLPTRSRRWRSNGRRSCSAANSPTSSRIQERRQTAP